MDSEEGKKAFNTLEDRRKYFYIAIFAFETLIYIAVLVGSIPTYSTLYVIHAIASDYLVIIGLIYSYACLSILLKKNHPKRHGEIKKQMGYFLLAEIVPLCISGFFNVMLVLHNYKIIGDEHIQNI